jgi:copper(I)-binding protein
VNHIRPQRAANLKDRFSMLPITKFVAAFAAVVAFALPAAAQNVSAEEISITDAYVVVNGPDSATAFMTVTHNVNSADRLISVGVDVGIAEMFVPMDDGMGGTYLQKAPSGFDLAANEVFVMSPGGNEMRLSNLLTDLKDGDKVKVSLSFEWAGVVWAEAVVDNSRATAGTN